MTRFGFSRLREKRLKLKTLKCGVGKKKSKMHLENLCIRPDQAVRFCGAPHRHNLICSEFPDGL